MRKPEPEQRAALLDYSKCRDYINHKYKVDIDNFAGKTFGKNDDTEYQCFWHYICDGLHNGSELYLPDARDDHPEWVKKVLKMFYDEFDTDVTGDLVFWVSW